MSTVCIGRRVAGRAVEGVVVYYRIHGVPRIVGAKLVQIVPKRSTRSLCRRLFALFTRRNVVGAIPLVVCTRNHWVDNDSFALELPVAIAIGQWVGY
jgi:hypothetical protein